ncbi:hypothetical protein GCM10008088_13700 [Mesonia mobilis]|uniref:Uncharacterized protein n=1 Tax=Mesonia mobilis TaxID=369791 RepID=A0ABQ3BUV6_9FLAO|nr:hypothetical protein GCM10008088_13700 [Mesonia mobilis]
MKTQNNLTKPTQKLVNTNTRKPKISSISIFNSTSISQSHPELVEGSTNTVYIILYTTPKKLPTPH